MRFFVGLHHPSDAKHFDRCFISVNVLLRWKECQKCENEYPHPRKSDFPARDWIMDSGAFTELERHGRHRLSTYEYANQIRRWSECGNLLAAVSQDYMCEPWMLERTGLTVKDHQRLTIARYDLLVAERTGTYILPVLQGYDPNEYADHIGQYGDRLEEGAWVGVGSICKRNSDVGQVEKVLDAIKQKRPDLRLHGFGLKTTALKSGFVRQSLYSADSMAWSYAARRNGGNANDYGEAMAFSEKIRTTNVQLHLLAPC